MIAALVLAKTAMGFAQPALLAPMEAVALA